MILILTEGSSSIVACEPKEPSPIAIPANLIGGLVRPSRCLEMYGYRMRDEYGVEHQIGEWTYNVHSCITLSGQIHRASGHAGKDFDKIREETDLLVAVRMSVQCVVRIVIALTYKVFSRLIFISHYTAGLA